jgi:AraC family transcriptional regulator
LDGLTLVESRYTPSLRVPLHAHPEAFFCFILEGSYTEQCGKRTEIYDSGCVVFHPEAETHVDSFHKKGGHILSVAFSDVRLARLRLLAPVLTRMAHQRGGKAAWAARRLFEEFQAPDMISALAIEGLVLEILAEEVREPSIRATGRPPGWLCRAKDLVHARFDEKLSLDTIAGEVGIHPVHLARAFRNFYHCSIGDYVRRRRVEFACRQLGLPGISLATIALAAGFCSQSHFTTVFQRYTGMTPSTFRGRTRAR